MESDLEVLVEELLNIIYTVDQPALATGPNFGIGLRAGRPLLFESRWSCRAGFGRGGLAAEVDSDLIHGSLLGMFALLV